MIYALKKGKQFLLWGVMEIKESIMDVQKVVERCKDQQKCYWSERDDIVY